MRILEIFFLTILDFSPPQLFTPLKSNRTCNKDEVEELQNESTRNETTTCSTKYFPSLVFSKTRQKPRATPARKRDDVFSHPETRNRSCSATTTTEYFQHDYHRDRKHREIRRQRAGAVTENTTKNSKTHAFHAKSSARFTRLERHRNLGTVQLLHHESSSRFIRARRDICPNR